MYLRKMIEIIETDRICETKRLIKRIIYLKETHTTK